MAIPKELEKRSAERPQRLQMSYDEYRDWADEDVHAEWVDGEVIVFMPPKEIHQLTVGVLQWLLDGYVRLLGLGRVLVTPFEMRARPDGPARQPDVLFVARGHLSRIQPERLDGPADLVVEVISDDSVRRDRQDKFYEYRDAGVTEYWVIDPRPDKQRADFYVLDEDGEYQALERWVQAHPESVDESL